MFAPLGGSGLGGGSGRKKAPFGDVGVSLTDMFAWLKATSECFSGDFLK